MHTPPQYGLAIVARSSAERPRSSEVDTAFSSSATSTEAAYRRLAATILGLDVASLSNRLRSQRLSDQMALGERRAA
jgi:hypothetical protein